MRELPAHINVTIVLHPIAGTERRETRLESPPTMRYRNVAMLAARVIASVLVTLLAYLLTGSAR
jgi:hypothetical protein